MSLAAKPTSIALLSMSSPTGIEAALAAPGSGVTPELIKARLEAKIEASYVSIDDESCELMFCSYH